MSTRKAKTPARARDRLVHSRPGAVGAHHAEDQADVAAQRPHRVALVPGLLPGWRTADDGGIQQLFVLHGLLPDDTGHRQPHPAPQTPGAEGGQ
ncbi:hypothetical protein ACIA98_43625 [Streptomyces sp. NPDC051366]|uniref:hypothetical protein n=1 Tax=Streptomyces sp. NPDC051366 TaxID=3365652 RepID=UPI0037A8E3C0